MSIRNKLAVITAAFAGGSVVATLLFGYVAVWTEETQWAWTAGLSLLTAGALAGAAWLLAHDDGTP